MTTIIKLNVFMLPIIEPDLRWRLRKDFYAQQREQAC